MNMNYSIFRLIKLKTTKDICSVANHNNRSNEYYPSNADKKRANDNKLLKGNGKSLDSFLSLTEGQKIRANAVLGYDIVLTCSNAFDSKIKQSKWEDSSIKWLEKTFGKDNVVNVWLHEDESAPHLHAFVVPIDSKGKLNASAFTGNANAMTQLQDSYYSSVKNYGLDRGIKHSRTTHINRKQYQARKQALEDRLKGMSKDELKDELIKTLIKLDQFRQIEMSNSSSFEKSIAENNELKAQNSDLSKKIKYYETKLSIISGIDEGKKVLDSFDTAIKLTKQLNSTFEYKYYLDMKKYKPSNPIKDIRTLREDVMYKNIAIISEKSKLKVFSKNNTFYQLPFKNLNLKVSSMFVSALASMNNFNCVPTKADFRSALKSKGLSDDEIDKLMNPSKDKEKE